MADKSFGVKQINLIGASGTPTLESPNNLNLNAINVAISTDLSVGGSVSVSEDITVTGGVNISGILTAASFVGDGSGLSGVVGSGSGVIINDDGSLVGTAGTIDFGTGLSVSAISAGIATVTATGGGGETYWTSTAAGIHTLSNVGIGTTNPTSALTVKGNTSLETLNVSGVSTFPLNVSVGVDFLHQGASVGKVRISGDGVYGNGRLAFYNGSNNEVAVWDSNLSTGSIDIYNYTNSGTQNITISAGSSVVLQHGGTNTKLQTLGSGVSVTGTTFTNQLSVSGVSTLSSNVSVGGTISVDGGVKLATNNATIVGTSGTVGEIKQIGGAPFFYDGSAWREFVLSSGTPVTVPADTEWDSVIFRATFDDDYTDAKFGATPVFVSAGSSIVGAAVTIGTGAYRNDGSVGAGISYAYRSEYDFTGSWTIEFWMYVDSNPVFSDPLYPLSLVSMNSTTGIGTSGNWTIAMYEGSFGNKFISWFNQNKLSYANGVALYLVSDSVWNDAIRNRWNHFALVRESDNGSLHFYVNGTEQSQTTNDIVIDNDILDISSNGLHFGGDTTFRVGVTTFNSIATADVIFDDVRISCGVGTAGQRYNSIGISTYATFTPPTTALPTTGTLSSYIQPPGDKYGEIGLGTSPTWRGTSGVTVSQQSSGNYRVSFASTYTNSNDYYVLSQGMDQGFASYVGIARSTTHVDLSINKQSDDTAVDTGSLAVQIKNHI
jgi:hypothetical protein